MALSMMDYSVSVTPAASSMKSENKLVVMQVSIAITVLQITLSGQKSQPGTSKSPAHVYLILFQVCDRIFNMGGVLMGTSASWLKSLEYFGGNSQTGLEHVNQHSLALEDITRKAFRWICLQDCAVDLRKCTRDPFVSHIFCCPHREVCCCHADATSVVEQLSVL